MATRQFNVFVEGNDDHDLVLELLQQLKDVRLDLTRKVKRATTYLQLQPSGDTILLLATGGWSKLAESEVLFRQAHDSGGRNLVVFDADADDGQHPSGGPAKRTVAIQAAVAEFDPNPAIFLFPQPGQEGNIETLLLQLTQPAHQRVMVCYDAYEECLRQFTNADGSSFYNAPSNKRRIYDYVNVMPLTGEQWQRHHEKGGQKIFENVELWNLNSSAIQPLRDFLNQYIQ